MSSLCLSFPHARKFAIATLLGASFLASPVMAADPAPVKSPAAAAAISDKGETVEQRIADLHTSLKITAAEEPKWQAVSQTMRDNAAQMEALVADKRRQAPASMTALDDLMTYQEFAQAHVDGLKSLTASFKTLYDAMPDADKKNADMVFQTFGHAPAKAARP